MIKIRNLKMLDRDFDRISKRVGLDVGLVVKKLSFDIFADVVAGTPVDTGRAMNNWVISVGSPSRVIVDEGGTAGMVEGAKVGEAMSALATVPPYSTVWISNNLPYIGVLEEGTSKQAPDGWVAAAIENNLRQLARFAA